MDVCPRTGQPCPHEKNIYITEIHNEKSETFRLCEHCTNPEYKEYKNFITSFISQSLLSLFGFKPNKKENCPQCGCTARDIAKASKMGCDYCYEYFKNDMLPVIKQLHGGADKHLGKKPSHKQKISLLEEELKKAVSEERYEDAAKIRDELKNISR